MEIDRVDHFVLTVRDVEATCAFYSRVLGLQAVTHGGGRRALQCGRQKINLQQVGREADLRATQPLPGAGDFCLITRLPIEQVAERVRAAGIALEGGPVERGGALGPMQSVYFRDPDGNLVEVARYPDEVAAD
jgi:catechol 2,3-dioxygenase-like lactoylglutathione lyase family enzyme